MTDLVLIDDDPLIQGTWNMVAKLKKHNLLCFNSIEEFLEKKLPLSIPVYLDYHFNSGANGLVLCKDIYRAGYKNLYITTGSARTIHEKPDEVLAILEKDYPL